MFDIPSLPSIKPKAAAPKPGQMFIEDNQLHDVLPWLALQTFVSTEKDLYRELLEIISLHRRVMWKN